MTDWLSQLSAPAPPRDPVADGICPKRQELMHRSLTWLDYFDGVLTAIWSDPSGVQLWLGTWADCDETCHRWLFTPISRFEAEVLKVVERDGSADDNNFDRLLAIWGRGQILVLDFVGAGENIKNAWALKLSELAPEFQPTLLH